MNKYEITKINEQYRPNNKIYLTLSSIHIPNEFSAKPFFTFLSSNSENQHQPNSYIETNQLNLSKPTSKTNYNKQLQLKNTQPSILLVELGDRGKSSSQSA